MRRLNELSTVKKTTLALALAGALIMGYLTLLHYQDGGSSFCNFGAGFSCQIVNQSVYSEVFGIPVSLLGLAYFVGVMAVILYGVAWALVAIQLVTVSSLVFSFYLSFVEAKLLYTFCLFCEASKLIMFGILGLTFKPSRLQEKQSEPWMYGVALIAGAMVTLLISKSHS